MKALIEIGQLNRETCPKCGKDTKIDTKTTVHCFRCKETFPKTYEAYFVKVRQYGFYIRIIHNHFIPCDKCQDEFEKVLVEGIKNWYIEEGMPLKVELDHFINQWRFRFRWIGISQRTDTDVVLLCKECSKNLELGIVDAHEWTIGNKDYEPAIELWRKWDLDGKRTDRLFYALEKVLDRLKKAYMNPNWKKAMEQKIIETLMKCKTTKMVDDYLSKLEKMVF